MYLSVLVLFMFCSMYNPLIGIKYIFGRLFKLILVPFWHIGMSIFNYISLTISVLPSIKKCMNIGYKFYLNLLSKKLKFAKFDLFMGGGGEGSAKKIIKKSHFFVLFILKTFLQNSCLYY